MKRGCFFLLILIFSFLLIRCSDSSPSSPTTITATTVIKKPVVIRETGKGFDKIQEAIDAATAGQHIDVSAGTYMENLVIEKQLYLTGEDRNTTIIDGKEGDKYTVRFSTGAKDSEIRGFTIKNGTDIGIFCNFTSVIIERNIVQENYTGIELFLTSGEISGVIVKNNERNGINLLSCLPWMEVKESLIEENGSGVFCYENGFSAIMSSTIKNNLNIGIACLDTSLDAGGGAGGSPGYNVIRNNEGWNFDNQCNPYPIKAEYNFWDHNTAEEIDHFDIYDDDEDPPVTHWPSAAVDFEPFLTGEPSASLRIKPRLLSASSLFRDFFRSLFRADLPASAMHLSSSFEPKLHIAHFDLMRASYRPLADERYYPPLMLRASR